MSSTILLFGDLHLRKGHLQQGSETVQEIVEKTRVCQPDIIVLLGDVLHTHDMVYVGAFRLLEELIDQLRTLAEVYVLVGNHDFINASENQTQEHPLGPFKKWEGVHIVDKAKIIRVSGHRILMTPYIPYGKDRFIKMVDASHGKLTQEIDIILAHQPFFGSGPQGRLLSRRLPYGFFGSYSR